MGLSSFSLSILKQGVLGLCISCYTGPQFPYLRSPAQLPYLKLWTGENCLPFMVHTHREAVFSGVRDAGAWGHTVLTPNPVSVLR